MAALTASSASTFQSLASFSHPNLLEQWSFTGGRESSCAMIVFLIFPAWKMSVCGSGMWVWAETPVKIHKPLQASILWSFQWWNCCWRWHCHNQKSWIWRRRCAVTWDRLQFAISLRRHMQVPPLDLCPHSGWTCRGSPHSSVVHSVRLPNHDG